MNLTRTHGALLRTSPAGTEHRAHVTAEGNIALVDWYGERPIATRVVTVDEAMRLGDFAATIARQKQEVAA